ncbi:MAG: ABC transporter substrate-binding protein [Bacillota bacterium]|nr:ABC transporter substrate-binding protein [Bacillota bacterium]
MKRSRSSKLILLIMLLILTLISSACGGAPTPVEDDQQEPSEQPAETEQTEDDGMIFDGETIKVGLFVPITGSAADLGRRVVDGVKMAADEINEQGGILGGMVEVIVEDDEGVPAQSVNAITKLITQDNVPVVMGSLPSSCTIAAMTISERYGIPHIAANSSSPAITNMGNQYIYQTIPNDSIQAVNLAEYAITDRNFERIALIHANDDYGLGGKDPFIDKAAELGVEPFVESYNPGDRDFTAQIVNIRNFDPDAVVIWGLATEAALIVNQLRQQNIDVQVLGAGGIPGQTFIDLAGENSEGVIVTNTFLPDPENEVVVEFLNRFEEKYGYTPDLTSAQPYDAATMLFEAIAEGRSLDPEMINQQLSSVSGFEGVTGDITFSENHSVPDKRVYISQLVDGQWTLVK